MAPNKSSDKGIPVAGVAAGVAAAVAAAGAAYYFYGAKGAKAHRTKAVKWAADMKKEVVKEAKKLKEIDDVVMHEIVDRVAGTYRAAKQVDPVALMDAANELKDNWQRVAKELKSAGARGKQSVRKAKKAMKKTAKKRAKKAAKKRA